MQGRYQKRTSLCHKQIIQVRFTFEDSQNCSKQFGKILQEILNWITYSSKTETSFLLKRQRAQEKHLRWLSLFWN